MVAITGRLEAMLLHAVRVVIMHDDLILIPVE